MRKTVSLALSALLLTSGLLLAGCGRPSPDMPPHIGQVHR